MNKPNQSTDGILWMLDTYADCVVLKAKTKDGTWCVLSYYPGEGIVIHSSISPEHEKTLPLDGDKIQVSQ